MKRMLLQWMVMSSAFIMLSVLSGSDMNSCLPEPITPVDPPCQWDSDCDTGFTCAADGKCVKAETPECLSDSDCDFGYECDAYKECVESQCHNGSKSQGYNWKGCLDMFKCAFVDDVAMNHGNGQCRPFDKTCQYNSDCPFGFECGAGPNGIGPRCLPSDCHSGGQINNDSGVKPCPQGLQCLMGDGVDLNHGNGWCE